MATKDLKEPLRFDNAMKVQDVVWYMRLADLPRDENRLIINQLFNGDPPFDPALAEENNVSINRNDLEGVNLLAQARRQWNQAFLSSENYFTVTLDSGPPNRRREWGHTITKAINRQLKGSRRYMEEKRSVGGNVMLHGPGLTTFKNRRCVITTPLLPSAVMIPSETDIDFDNLTYFALFREWTPAQLYEMTHGPTTDPGWEMDVVDSQLNYVMNQVTKQPNATAYQYMPTRIEELKKQDMGFWGSDAVPTIDAWDFYFRQADDDGKGWYRRIILDWQVAEGLTKNANRPDYSNEYANGKFLYTSKHRKFANSLAEILQCNNADCSAVFPQKYHSQRSLGWMLWGICDLQNRLHCKFNEAVFQQLMWFFRVASNADFTRLKQANFTQLGVVPPGVDWIKAQDRYTPPLPLVEYAFQRNRGLMNESAASFSQDFDRERGQKEMTATETMARVNAINALVNGMMTLSYNYEEFKYKEQARRVCIPNNPDPIAKAAVAEMLKKGVPEAMIDCDRWIVKAERVLGAGNATVAMAQVQFLQGIRKNLGPDAQRLADHISLEQVLDDYSLAEELAPVQGQQLASNSMHDAQLTTERLMRGLPLAPRPEMVYEDYVKVWIADLELMVGNTEQTTGMATPADIKGYDNMIATANLFLKQMATNEEEIPKVRAYADRLKKIGNLVKAFKQRFTAQMEKAQAQGANGNGGPDPAKIVDAQIQAAMGKQKLEQDQTAHSQRTAERQVSFDLEQQRKDRQTDAEIRRQNEKAAHELHATNLQVAHDIANTNAQAATDRALQAEEPASE